MFQKFRKRIGSKLTQGWIQKSNIYRTDKLRFAHLHQSMTSWPTKDHLNNPKCVVSMLNMGVADDNMLAED